MLKQIALFILVVSFGQIAAAESLQLKGTTEDDRACSAEYTVDEKSQVAVIRAEVDDQTVFEASYQLNQDLETGALIAVGGTDTPLVETGKLLHTRGYGIYATHNAKPNVIFGGLFAVKRKLMLAIGGPQANELTGFQVTTELGDSRCFNFAR